MAILKMKDVRKMQNKERQDKLTELRFALIKSKVQSAKGGAQKTKEIKKAIARLLTH